MKVLLIELPSSREELNEPIGLGTIAGYAQQHSSVTSLQIDFHWSQLGPLTLSRSALKGYALIGVSAQIGSLEAFHEIYCNSIAPSGVPTIVGNLIPTYEPRVLLDRYPEIVCVKGEGELAFAQIIDLIAQGNEHFKSELAHIPNLVYRTGDTIATTSNVKTALETIGQVARPFLPEISREGGLARIEGSRGCHWGRCEFCSVAARFGLGSWRPFPVEQVVAQLSELSNIFRKRLLVIQFVLTRR